MGSQLPDVKIIDATGKESIWHLKNGTNIIGSSPEADITIKGGQISPRHCQLIVGDEYIFLQDLHSEAGTFIANIAVSDEQAVRLLVDQNFRFGDFQAYVQWNQPQSTTEENSAQPLNDQPVTDGVLLQYRVNDMGWEQLPLLPGDHIIGRSPEAALVICDPRASRQHARITVKNDGEFFIMDLGSANGTQKREKPLRQRVAESLAFDEIVKIANYELRVAPLTPQALINGQIASELKQAVSLPEAQPATVTYILHYREENGEWQEYHLKHGVNLIGRTPEMDLHLASNMISRKHASLVWDDGSVFINDLNSQNGISIDGKRISPDTAVPLQPGQTFQIANFTLTLKEQPFSTASQPAKEMPVLQAHLPHYEADKTILGAEAGVDIASLGRETDAAPMNLAGHERVTIGRADDNMIRLSHPLVSRYHAVIERMGTRTRIVDLQSANGLFINGEVVDTASWLRPGDIIKIGPYLINFTGNELRTSDEQSYTIDVVGLQKWVTKDINLLKEISLSIGKNEFVALVGMSGAGKSTLMDAINGFRPATDGKVFINGIDLYQNYNQFRSEIGNVPQRDIVHMELTAEQALSYAAELRMPPDATPQDRAKAVTDTLEDLGLTYRKDLTIARLSGGQIKRVSIGVELLTKPRLFFLDEPTSGLDPGTEYEMMRLLRRLADQGRTIMLITHATKNVMFCDKAIILANQGNLAFYGPPEEALVYFDQFRSHRERLEKVMEFDDIYRILEDPERGTPEEWARRYLQSKYAAYTHPQIANKSFQLQAAAPAKPPKEAGKKISSIKQLSILSRRYLRCLYQDKVSLLLTLSLAPLLGLMNFIWGSTLFDPVIGNAAKTMGVWFAVTVMGILVGYMGSIQELVKERPIYKRERAVGLKIIPYVMSKTWVGGALAFYQAFFILLFTIILAKPLVTESIGYLSMFITLTLVIFSSFILGLLISAISTNANTAQLIMIAAFVPQLLLAGVLQPLHMIVGGEFVSPIIVSRWSFENLVNATGMGAPLVADTCWMKLDREQRNALTNAEKDRQCSCMGANLFAKCSVIPGILSEDFYDNEAKEVLAMNRPEQPVAPDRLATPTPRNTPTTVPSPTFQPSPTYLPTPTAWATLTPLPPCSQPGQSNCLTYQNQQQVAADQMVEYQETRSAQFVDYRDNTEQQFEEYWETVGDQMDIYKEDINDQITEFSDEERENIDQYADENMSIAEDYQIDMENYSEDLSYYERRRQEAISSAEAIITILWDDYGGAFQGGIIPRLGYIGLITLVQFILLIYLLKKQDTV
jgi:ABC transport system ATP-binding/permease protein